MNKIQSIATLLLCLLASACSLTRNLPEGETLYRGIKSIDYDKHREAETGGQEKGVITALADAYTTVEGLLSGDASAMKPGEMVDEKTLRDSLRRASQKDREAYESAREEVEAVLSYAPNGAFMGSSFVTHPFPIRLLIYNRYAGSKSRFGRWMFNNFAASPVLMSNVNPRLRSTVAKNTLRSRGYFRARTSYELVPDSRDTLKGKVRYDIHPGPLYHLDSIAYLNFPPHHPCQPRSPRPASRRPVQRRQPRGGAHPNRRCLARGGLLLPAQRTHHLPCRHAADAHDGEDAGAARTHSSGRSHEAILYR